MIHLIAVEAKSSTRVTRADTRGIRAFRDSYPRLEHGIGVVVAAVRETTMIAEDIIAIPHDIA